MSDRDGSHECRPDRSALSLVFWDDFTSRELNGERWIAHYLPHWSTPERTAARYVIDHDGLRLLIEADQPAWRPEDGGMRASNIQTGTFSGPLGSSLGQHRHRPDLRVRTPQPTRRLWTPSSGLVEATVCASPDPDCMVGIWLVGFEHDSPQQSGEVCIAELFGDAIGSGGSKVRLGIKAHNDPKLQDDMADVALDIDASEEHVYAAEWDARRARFFVDDVLVRTVDQGLDYPLQLMVDLFEFPGSGRRDPGRYPKSACVRGIRGYQRAQAADARAPTRPAVAPRP